MEFDTMRLLDFVSLATDLLQCERQTQNTNAYAHAHVMQFCLHYFLLCRLYCKS